jgi:hypothetical protein
VLCTTCLTPQYLGRPPHLNSFHASIYTLNSDYALRAFFEFQLILFPGSPPRCLLREQISSAGLPTFEFPFRSPRFKAGAFAISGTMEMERGAMVGCGS